MSIVTISRGSYSKGKEVAENVAQRLGYECIARDAIIDASKEFNIPEIKLIRAIHDAPTILERFNYSKEKSSPVCSCANRRCFDLKTMVALSPYTLRE